MNLNEVLEIAAEKGNLEVVKFLVEEGVDVHTYDDCALCGAAEKGHLEVVKFLVAKGADVHARDNYALRWAADKGHLEIVKFLKSVLSERQEK